LLDAYIDVVNNITKKKIYFAKDIRSVKRQQRVNNLGAHRGPKLKNKSIICPKT